MDSVFILHDKIYTGGDRSIVVTNGITGVCACVYACDLCLCVCSRECENLRVAIICCV